MKRQQAEAWFSQLSIQWPWWPWCSWAFSNPEWACNFCALQNIQVMNQTALRELLLNELKLQEKFNPDRLFDTANQFLPHLKKQDVVRWLKKYVRIRNEIWLKTKKYAYLTVSSIDEQVADLLKEAWIEEVYLWIDHFHADSLKTQNKSFKSWATLKRALDALRSAWIKFRAWVVLWAVNETTDTLISVRWWIDWILSEYNDILEAIWVFPVEIIPWARVFNNMKSQGVWIDIIEKFERTWYLWRNDQKDLTRKYIEHNSSISFDDISSLEQEIVRKVKARWWVWYTVDRTE